MGEGTSTIYKVFVQNKNIFQTGKDYGAGRGRYLFKEWQLKAMIMHKPTFEIAFKREKR